MGIDLYFLLAIIFLVGIGAVIGAGILIYNIRKRNEAKEMMDNPMRTINCEETFSCTPQTLFDALHTPSSVRSWWHADRIIVIPREGGVFTAAWGEHEDDPMHVSSGVYKVFAPPHKIVLVDLKYHATEGPTMPDAPISITYDITPHPEGAHLKLTHAGFPENSEADAYFEACIQGWKMSLDSLRSHLETSVPSP